MISNPNNNRDAYVPDRRRAAAFLGAATMCGIFAALLANPVGTSIWGAGSALFGWLGAKECYAARHHPCCKRVRFLAPIVGGSAAAPASVEMARLCSN